MSYERTLPGHRFILNVFPAKILLTDIYAIFRPKRPHRDMPARAEDPEMLLLTMTPMDRVNTRRRRHKMTKKKKKKKKRVRDTTYEKKKIDTQVRLSLVHLLSFP